MKWVPIITNFKRPIRHLVKLILYENDVKLLKFKTSPGFFKPDKENLAVISDWKLYNNAIEEIISDTSKFENLSEDPTLKREASL